MTNTAQNVYDVLNHTLTSIIQVSEYLPVTDAHFIGYRMQELMQIQKEIQKADNIPVSDLNKMYDSVLMRIEELQRNLDRCKQSIESDRVLCNRYVHDDWE